MTSNYTIADKYGNNSRTIESEETILAWVASDDLKWAVITGPDGVIWSGLGRDLAHLLDTMSWEKLRQVCEASGWNQNVILGEASE